MNWGYVIIGCALVLIAGFVGADSISSTIVCNGASWVSSSVLSQGQMYAASLFTTDIAVLMRDLNVGADGTIKTVTNAWSTGPLGVDEYSAQGTNETHDYDRCIFTLPENGTTSRDEITYMGLMQTGQYASTRTLDSSKTGAVTTGTGTKKGKFIHVISFFHLVQGILQSPEYGICRDNWRHHPSQAEVRSAGEKKIKFLPFHPGLLHN